MRKRKSKGSLQRGSHLSLQRRGIIRRRQRLANRRQLSQWMVLTKEK